MAIGINLLPELGKEEAKKSAMIKKANLAASLLLILDLLVALGVFLYRANLVDKYNSLNKTSDTLREEIENLQEVEWNLLALKSKTSSVASLLKEKTYLSPLFSRLEQLTPSGIRYINISIDKKERVLINAEANSFSEIAGFVRVLKEGLSLGNEEKGTSLLFENVILSSANIEPTSGLIQFIIIFDIKEGT